MPEYFPSEHSMPDHSLSEHSTPEHLTPAQIERFALPGDSPDAERTRANAHLQTCGQCRAAFQKALSISAPALLARLKGDEEIPYRRQAQECLDDDIVIRYAAGTAKGVEIDLVEMHLEFCASCRVQIAELAARFKAMEIMDTTTLVVTKQAAAGPLAAEPLTAEPLTAGKELATAGKEPAAPLLSAAQKNQENKGTAGIAPLFGARLREGPAKPRLAWGLALGGGAITVACIALLHPGNRRQMPAPATSYRLISRSAQPALPLRNAPPYTDSAKPADSAEPAEQRIASLARKGGRIMGGPASKFIALFRPDGVRVNSLRPSFRWQAVPHAAAYELTCIPQEERAKDRRQKTEGSKQNTEGRRQKAVDKIAGVVVYTVAADAPDLRADVVWTIPATHPALHPATTYTWIVRALGADRSLLARSSTYEELFFRTPEADAGRAR